MKIPIEKKRLFKVLEDMEPTGMAGSFYVFVLGDDEAIQVLADMGFVELRSGGLVLSHIDEQKKIDGTYESVSVHLKNDFLTQVGLALFREHDENFD